MSTLERVGPTNQLLYLIKFLDKNIFDPIIVTLSPEPPNSSYDLFNEMDIKIESLGLSRLKGIFLIKKRLNNLITKCKPDIIQTLGFRADRVKIKFNTPKIIILRTSPKQTKTLPLKPTYLGQLLTKYLFRFHLLYVRKCRFVVVCSKSLSMELRKLYNVKFRYIQNGVDNQTYTSISDKIKNKIRNELNFPVDKKIFISVSSLIPTKNTSFIIELFKSWDYLKDSILIILGDGTEYNKFKKSVKNYTNIQLYGDVREVVEYLQASDYFISASKGEGLPNAVLEAMSTGTPCILSDIPPHREIMGSSDLGVTFENNNLEDLKRKIIQINNMDYKYLSTNCRDNIAKNFSAQTMSLNYQKLYSEILNF